ncbi:MAG: hypothetical protein HYY64_13310 [Candidatus Rokubacteria bacterium]|nr:hypothetical protein [Candidatus Rokubacteria bacterium]
MSEEAARPLARDAMAPPAAEWGRRLSDRIRAALDAGDLDGARRLAVEGDGEARSLEKEYALMYKGLGITIRILLDLLGETVARCSASDRPVAGEALGKLLRRFKADMLALFQRAWGASVEVAGSSGGGDVPGALTSTAHLLSEAERLFAREQALRAQEVLQAIGRGETERARALLDRKERDEYVPLHDRLVRFMAEAFGYVLTQFGPAELYRFHRATAEGQRRGFEQWERLPAADFARASVFLVKQHMGDLEVREDDEKFTIILTPCGSGGRLRLAGAYSGPEALPFVEGAGPLTAGRERFPVYCTHCPIWNDAAPREWFGRPQWVLENPSRSDGSCTVHIYKARDATGPAAR